MGQPHSFYSLRFKLHYVGDSDKYSEEDLSETKE